MAVKYIVETKSMWSKTNGWSDHFARITSTKTKKSLVIDNVGGQSNAAGLLFRLDVVNDWSEVYETHHYVDSVRDWRRQAENASQGIYEHTVTAKMIRALNRKG